MIPGPNALTVSTDIRRIVDALTGGDPGNPAVVTVPTPSAFYHGQVTVEAAGTAVALGEAQAITTGVTIKAHHNNTGNIYVGGPAVDATNGYVLAAGEAALLLVDDVAAVFVDADENGDGVSWHS